MSASETHNRANMGMAHDSSLAAFARIAEAVRGLPVTVNATVATAFGCPFEGDQPPDKIAAIVARYLDLGVDGVTLADTTGMANPQQVGDLVRRVLGQVPADHLTLHFHDTRGLGLGQRAGGARGRRPALRRFAGWARRLPLRARRLGQCLHRGSGQSVPRDRPRHRPRPAGADPPIPRPAAAGRA